MRKSVKFSQFQSQRTADCVAQWKCKMINYAISLLQKLQFFSTLVSFGITTFK